MPATVSHRTLVDLIFAGRPTAAFSRGGVPRCRPRGQTSQGADDRRRLSLRPSSCRAVVRGTDD